MFERIILTCNYSPWSHYSGGGQRSTHALGSALSELGYEVDVVFTKALTESIDVPQSLPYTLHWAAFAGFRSDGKNPLRAANALAVARVVGRILRDGQKTVVNAQGEEGALAPRQCQRYNAGFVQTPRYPKFADPLGGKLGGRLWLRPKFIALGHALRHADRICPTSKASAEDLIRHYELRRDRIEVIPNGIADAFVHCTRRSDAKDGPLVYFGRLSATKGVHDLVDAWLGIERPRPLWIGGVGPEKEALRTKIEAAGRADQVRWLGWCSAAQMAEVLCQAGAAVLPSHEESFGNTMVEAMAAGAPLITTRVGSIPEVVGHETHAMLLPARDVTAIRAALHELEAHPDAFEQRAREASRFARQVYSWRATAQQYVQIYKVILRDKERAARL